MSKDYEIINYIELVGYDKQAKILNLNQDAKIIYGDFINHTIYKFSNTGFSKPGILILEENELVFYGSKSFLEKESLLKFKYENLSIGSTPAFVINLIIDAPTEETDKAKFSISWGDYITKNIKKVFLRNLSEKIEINVLKRAKEYLKSKDLSSVAYFYYNKVFSHKIFNEEFLIKYIDLIRQDVAKNSNEHPNTYSKVLKQKKEFLKNIYPNAHDFLDNVLPEALASLSQESNLDFLNGMYNDYIYLENDQAVHINQLLKMPAVKKIVDEETGKIAADLKKKIHDDYKNKIEEYSNKLEIEKNIYREIIKDNIILPKIENLDSENIEDIIDNIINFYYRFKTINARIPDSFTVDKLRFQEGKEMLVRIMNSMSLSYLKIVDPYFFKSELELLERVPKDIEISILTYAIGIGSYQNKLKEFEAKLAELRKERFAKIKVKIIKFKKQQGTPLHDRALFSEDFGLSFSNSFSQIGQKHNVIIQRIINNKEREVAIFDDFWFLQNEIYRGGKVKKLTIYEI